MRKVFILLLLLLLVGCNQQIDSVGSPPPITVDIGDSKYSMTMGTYSWTKKGLYSSSSVVADAASPNQIAEDMEPIYVESDSEIEINTTGNPILSTYLWNEASRDVEVPLDDNKFKVPDEAGRYIYEVVAEWEEGDGSYTIVLEVK